MRINSRRTVGKPPGPDTEKSADFLDLFELMTSNIELELLLSGLVPRLMDCTESQCGAFYLANNATNKLEIKYSAGLAKAAYNEFDIAIGEGLLGLAAQKKDITIISDVADDSLFVIKTFLGSFRPRAMMLVPVIFQDQLMGLLALSSVYDYKSSHKELITSIRYLIGAAMSNSVTYERTKRLTNELKFQNKLIADLNNDLEDRLMERTSLINTALDGFPDCAVFSLEPNGSVMLWNKTAEKVYGVPASEAMGADGPRILGRGSEARAAIFRFKIEYAQQNGVFKEKGMRYDYRGVPYMADITYTSTPYNRGGFALTHVNRILEGTAYRTDK